MGLYYCNWRRTVLLYITTDSKEFFLKCLAIFFKQENVNQKYETHPVKSYFNKQLLIIYMVKVVKLYFYLKTCCIMVNYKFTTENGCDQKVGCTTVPGDGLYYCT